ncbi:response regulator transcription factor [Robbsia sp. Bb-Pol-6]|uniref:Response regulator transcription factor n=1 Tax=Robbsia betulipollinis TaxID=2981849 RepID=A0ABT3ZKR8_9BURK|nr:response regulator transcription factor [Robbsia betulipollinis]MCY0387129.1 response regulator transcription factor [Robbsia betulipollinis]
MTQPIRVIIADDHPLILLGTALSLADRKQFQVTGKARNSTELIALLTSEPCDVLVCDLAMPGGSYGDGLPMIAYIHRHFPQVRLIVQTMLDNPGILKGLQQSGVKGVLNKGDDMTLITAAVLGVMGGGAYVGPSIRKAFERVGMNEQEGGVAATLSKRESEVLRLYVGGATVKEIASSLNRSVKTISTQKMCAMQKIGVTRDADLFKYAQMNGFLNLPGDVLGPD